jgi:PST family polysaccharide transporter
MLLFGGYLTGFNLTNYFSRNADNMLIGWYWGAAPLGLYAQAYRLLLFPLQQIGGPLTGVTIPVLSRTIDDPARYRRAYTKMLESLLLITTPLMAFVLATCDLCIDVILGPQWNEAVPIFAWLGIAALVQPFTSTLGWLLISQGRGREMFGWSVFASIVSVVSFAVGLPWGPVYVAAAYVIANLTLHMPSLVYLATREGPVRARDLVPCVRVPCFLAIAVLIESLLIRNVVATGNSFVDLAIYFLGATVVWIGAMLMTSAGRRRLVYYGKSLAGR